MQRFDPASMSENTSPTVRALRTFVERTVEAEVDAVMAAHGEAVAGIVEQSLRSAVYNIFHNNPAVHTRVKEDRHAFDAAVQQLFDIQPKPEEV